MPPTGVVADRTEQHQAVLRGHPMHVERAHVTPSGQGAAPHLCSPPLAASNGIEIAYETFGAPNSRPLLLVTDLGAQMLVWHPELCATLAAEDFFMVRYDNRDVRLSTLWASKAR